MDDTYKVSIVNPLSFPPEKRVRSGITVTKAYGYEGKLTDAQLKAIEADDQLDVEKVSPSKAAPAAPKAQAKKSADTAKSSK